MFHVTKLVTAHVAYEPTSVPSQAERQTIASLTTEHITSVYTDTLPTDSMHSHTNFTTQRTTSAEANYSSTLHQ